MEIYERFEPVFNDVSRPFKTLKASSKILLHKPAMADHNRLSCQSITGESGQK